MQKILVILPYKQSSSQGNELKLSLRCWEKFCNFDYHFIVIGEFDESFKIEFTWVEFIKCKSIEKIEGQYNPHLDILNKFKIIFEMYSNTYDGFIYMTDDEYAIKPFDLTDITTIYYLNLTFNGQKDKPTYFWDHDKWKTKQLLEKNNLPCINYTIHYPCYFEFKKLKEIWDKFNMFEESYVFDDIYFNYFEHEYPIKVDNIRLGIWNYRIYKTKFKCALYKPNIKFICNSVNGWSKELENSLEQLIKEEST